ncbi:MAG TPA: NADPH-dependent F420 reductase [Actinomycetes bacterium]
MADQLTLGLLGGTGPQGRGLALRFALAGHEVLLGSRDEERCQRVVAELLSNHDLPIRPVVNEQAAADAEVVLLTFPFEGQAALLPALAGALAGKVVVDVVNPLGWDELGAFMLPVAEGSAAEQAQALLPASRVTAAFHHAPPRLLADPSREVDSDVLVVGDDPAARAVVIGLADVIPGCRGIDAGPLRLARYLEGLTAVLVSVNRRYKIHAGVRITRLSEERRRRAAGEEGP